MKKMNEESVKEPKEQNTVEMTDNKINDSARRISDADDDEEEVDFDIDDDSDELFEAVAEQCGCDSDDAKRIVAVARMKGDSFENISDYSIDGDIVSVDSSDYKVIEGYYDFEEYATECVENTLDDLGIEALAEYAQEEAIEKFCSYNWEEDMHESNLGYAGDIAGDVATDGHKNRLIEEAVERGVISDDDLDEDGDYNGGDYTELIDDFADDMDSDYSTMSEWFDSIYGRGWAREVSKSLDNYFDWRGIAEWVVDMDGADAQVPDDYSTEEVDGEDYYIIEW